jgi:hypothetical protein
MNAMPVSVERLVRNQLVFREVNDRIRELAERFEVEGPLEFICECSREECTEKVSLAADEYNGVRSSPTLFVIVPGHETLKVERVVDVNERFMLVEKIKLTDEVVADHGRRVS